MFRLSSNCRVRNGGPAEDEAATQRGWIACLRLLIQRLQIRSRSSQALGCVRSRLQRHAQMILTPTHNTELSLPKRKYSLVASVAARCPPSSARCGMSWQGASSVFEVRSQTDITPWSRLQSSSRAQYGKRRAQLLGLNRSLGFSCCVWL